MPTEPVQLALVSAISGIVIAYLGYQTKQRVDAKKSETPPKDRLDQLMDGYERFIKQKDAEFDRKIEYIDLLEKELETLKKHFNDMENAVKVANQELEKSRLENVELRRMLDEMRKEYNDSKRKVT